MRLHALKVGYRGRLEFSQPCIVKNHAAVRVRGRDSRVVLGKMVVIDRGSLIEAFDGGHISLAGRNYVSRNCMIVSAFSIQIGEGTTIGPGTVIYDHDHNFRNPKDPSAFVGAAVSIADGVWIGANVVILKGVSIGTGSVIGAGAIVARSIPDRSVVTSTSAMRIRDLPDSVN